jgi:YgiT-type zinc finger domain-containing protein
MQLNFVMMRISGRHNRPPPALSNWLTVYVPALSLAYAWCSALIRAGSRPPTVHRQIETEVTMFRCHVCGKTESRPELVNEVFDIDGKPVRVEHIPATVCAHCGEPVFSRDTTERVRRMVHGEATPIKSIQMDVFAYR